MQLPKKSDAACFSPIADKKSSFAPRCAKCEKPAMGGVMEKFTDDTYTVRFECGDHGSNFVMTVANMHPRWQALSKIAPGTYRVVKAQSYSVSTSVLGDTSSVLGDTSS